MSITLLRTTCSAIGLASAVLAAGGGLAAQEGPVTVPFSDPGRIGSVRVTLLSGGITVKGTNRRDVVIIEHSGPLPNVPTGTPASPRSRAGSTAGFRRLTQRPNIMITEENNQMAINMPAGSDEKNLTIETPLQVNLTVSTLDGDIAISDVEGELEVTNLDGQIQLNRVSGSVVANSLDGDVTVTMVRVAPGKPMAFTSFDGNVDVTLPASTRANLKLRSDDGEVLTDFNVVVAPSAPVRPNQTRNGRTWIEINQAILGAINGGGPEIELRTFDGDVIVRKAAQ